MNNELKRGGYVSSNRDSRVSKARKIERILSRRLELSRSSVLDLGAGSGILAEYFQPLVRKIIAADRDIASFEAPGIEHIATPEPELPFPDGTFDLVICNHVIEHVGTRAEQSDFLAEIHRVLRAGGLLYLAVPSCFAIVEPHYRIPLLSWFPQRVADSVVRLSGQGTWYDCNPYTRSGIQNAMRDAGFETEDAGTEAFYDYLALEASDRLLTKALHRIPAAVVKNLTWAMPTFVMLGKKAGESDLHL